MQDDLLIYDYQPLIKVSDGTYPVFMPQVRMSDTQTSFPIPIKAFILEPFGYMPVYNSLMPKGDIVVEGKPSFNEEDGKWYQTWDVRDFTDEEKEINLIILKSTLISQAETLLNSDISQGVSYTYEGKTYLVDVIPDKLTTLLCIKSIAKDSSDEELFQYSFLDGTLLTLTKSEFLSMWDSVMRSLYDFNKRFWKFREDVNSTVDAKELPLLPTTFKDQ